MGKKDLSPYAQQNYLVFFYSDGLGVGATIRDVWNVSGNEGNAPGNDWIVSVYFDGKVPLMKDLRGFWHETDGQRWWIRGLTATVIFEEVQNKYLDSDLGVIQGDDPRGLSFRAEMKLGEQP